MTSWIPKSPVAVLLMMVAPLGAADDDELLRRNEEPLVGAAAIREAFSAAFDANPKAKISLSMEALWFIAPDVAFEDGETVSFADGETPTSRSRYFVVHVKRQGV
jgi:ketosteroid isomerase-like protein